MLNEAEVEEAITSLDFPQSIVAALREGLSGVGLTRELLDKILEHVMADYDHAKVEPCEAVGVVAA